MPQIGGKPVKKSSKTKSKSSSTSKRHFTVVIGTKEHGLYCSSSPSSAARKAVTKLCGKNVKNVEFCLREITQGSKKKTYGPYLGHVEKLAKPIELKGRVIERMPVARLKPKSSAKKGGMRGGEWDENVIRIFRSKQIEENNEKINNDYIDALKHLRNETGKYRDISDKDLIKLITYAIQEINMLEPLGNNLLNMNDLPNNLLAYRNICPDLVNDVKKAFYKTE
jgi:hypothetical protein